MTTRGDFLACLAALAAATGSAGCGGDEDPRGLCDADELRAALASASAGDEVHVGRCPLEGPFDVPAGVTLSGEGIGNSILFGPDDDVTVNVTAGETPSIVRDLSVESPIVGVRLLEAGTARVERVSITASRGLALAADGVTRLELSAVTLQGPITAGNADDLTSVPVATETATMGLVILEVGAAQLDEIDIAGFAGWGALLIDSETTWSGGTVATNLMVGVHVQGGHATLEDVEIRETLQGSQLLPTLGLVASRSATVDSTRLSLHDNENFGLLVSESSGAHTDLVVQDGGEAGVWLQHATDVDITGAEIVDNSFGGVVALESSGVHLADVNVARTGKATSIVGAQGSDEIGDGVQLVDSTTDIRVDGATLTDNWRVGLFIDLGGAADSGISLTDIDVSASGEAVVEAQPRHRGAIMQNGTVTDGWDAGVDRLGDTSVNDTADVSDLDVAEAFGDIPAIDPEGIRCVMGPNNDCD